MILGFGDLGFGDLVIWGSGVLGSKSLDPQIPKNPKTQNPRIPETTDPQRCLVSVVVLIVLLI